MMRLLFVDDEPRVLQGLRQSLRGQRKVWDAHFVDSGAGALDMLASARFDAVISDMRMPVMDGAELLARVRRIQPDALRFVLSGQMDDTTAARAAASAHRFLSKPCETATLVANLTRALGLREQLQSDELRRCIGGMAGLPSLPAHCAELGRALADESVSLLGISRIVEGDVGMAAKVLQLVNSAFFGLPRQIVSIEQATMHLGLSALHSLVVANALFEELTGGDIEQLGREQARSLLAAQYARRFVLEQRQAEVAGAAALLHNVGRLALMSQRPTEYRECCELGRAQGLSLERAQSTRLGVTDAAIGAYLLGLWGLPFEVVHAVGSQQAALETMTTLDAGAVVYLARALVTESSPTEPGEVVPLPDDLLSRLGVAHVIKDIRAQRAGRRAS
jgi:HD-like signal output (HDOD) protein/CheY-like chemotaxis protein